MCMCTKRDLLKSQDNNCLPLKIRNSQKTQLTSVKSAKVSLLLCFHRCPCGSPTTFKMISPIVNHSQT